MLKRSRLYNRLLIFLIAVAVSWHVIYAQQMNSSAGSALAPAVIPADLKNNIILGACFLGLLFTGVYQVDTDKMPDELKSQFMPKNLAVNFASNYFMYFACNFFHELGHGLAKKILTGNDFKIHLGRGSGSQAGKALLDSKYVSLEGLDPILGYNTIELSGCHPELVSGSMIVYSPLQKILINLAGGMSGILGYFILRTAMFFAYNTCMQKNRSFSQNLKDAFLNAITIDQMVTGQLLNMLAPMQFGGKLGGDAVTIWQELGIKNNTIKTAAEIQQYLAMLIFIALAFKKTNSKISDEHFIADKVLIGLSNYFLQGFLRFKSA